MTITTLRSEEPNGEQTARTITDGGRRTTVERLTDGVDVERRGDRENYRYVDLWVTDRAADGRFPMICLDIDEYYADDPERGAEELRTKWLEGFDELLEPISGDDWLTLREHWERDHGDDSADDATTSGGDTTDALSAREARERFAERLREAGVPTKRFIPVRDGEKGTRMPGHQQPENWMDADDPKLSGNYGVHPGQRLIEFDCDDYDDVHDTEALDGLPDTFTVKSPHTREDSPGHRYYAIAEGDETAIIDVLERYCGNGRNPEPSWGEVKYEGKYVVGPGSQLDGCTKDWCDRCADPDGGYYRIADDVPIATLTAEDVDEVLAADRELSTPDTTLPASEQFDLPPDDDTASGAGDGDDYAEYDEFLIEGDIRDALTHVAPDCGHTKWRNIGFALGDFFDDRDVALAIYREWSSGAMADAHSGEKWDSDAKNLAPDIIARAHAARDPDPDPDDDDDGNETVGIGTLIHHAREGGWNAPTPPAGARGENDSAGGGDGDGDGDGGPLASDDDVRATDGTTGREDGPTTPDLNADDVLATWEAIRNSMGGGGGEARFGRMLAAQQLIAEYRPMTQRTDRDPQVWIYDHDTGVYTENGTPTLRARLRERLGAVLSSYDRREILAIVHELSYGEPTDLGADPHLLCVRNGVIDLTDALEAAENGATPDEAARELTLRDHSPDYRFISYVDVEYNPDAHDDEHPGWERWTRYIGERVRTRDIQNAREYVAYCLHGGYPFKRVLLALGPTDSGKSTFLSAIGRMFPEGSAAAEPVQDLTNNRFSSANLHGAQVNIAGDLGTRQLKDLERFKTITGGEERIRAERKGQQAYTFKSTAKHLFAANQVPEVNNPDEAFINRWIFAEFPDTISETDDRVKERLLREETHEAILLWAIGGYVTLFGADGSPRGFSTERTIEAKRAMWNKHGDTIDRFIVGCLDVTGDPDDVVAQKDVYQAYTEFCHHAGKPAESKRSFTDTLTAQALVSDSQRRVESAFTDTARPRVYTGVRYSDRGAQFWAVAAGEISRDAIATDPSDDPDDWGDDRHVSAE